MRSIPALDAFQLRLTPFNSTPSKAANARYLDARRTLAAETKRWKATCEDYKRARRIVKAARHEVHKSRRAVRVEYR
jgi:hypothetical protein